MTSERWIAASPEAVWAVVCDPRMQPRLDARVRVDAIEGPAGVVGSSYDAIARGRRVHAVVSVSEPGRRLSTEFTARGRPVAAQHAELVADGGATLLRWTVVSRVGRMLRPLAAANARRELPRWLAAVAREAEAR